jgi:hypothetical protein
VEDWVGDGECSEKRIDRVDMRDVHSAAELEKPLASMITFRSSRQKCQAVCKRPT